MANLIRFAKSGSDWTLNDLDSYHTSFNLMDALSFFGLQVREDMVRYSLRKTLTTLHITGVATTFG